MPEPSLMAAFLAGLLSFVSPCVLPLVPSYLTYVTGLSLAQLTAAGGRQGGRTGIIVNALVFIGGFSFVFIAFGASASLLGQVLIDYQDPVRKIGGLLTILFGLYLAGILKPAFLMRERRVRLRSRPVGYIGSLLIGAAFAAGWTPCVGPVLGSVLMYAGTTETMADGVTLLAYYSLGLALPLFASALAMDRFLAGFQRIRGYLGLVSAVSGGVLVLWGVALFTDGLPVLTAFLERHGIGWSGG